MATRRSFGGSLASALARARVGILVGAAGMLFGAHSLAAPFGRDQGLFHYIGREWLRAGAIPYRDTFDLKPPPIYAIYAFAVLLFGDGMWPIRLIEWVLAVPMGLAAAALATPRGEKVPPFRLGLGVLVAQIAYFGFFDFWNTGQCEIWCCAAIIFALWFLLRTNLSAVASAAAAGVLAGFTVAMKPPAALMALVVGGVILLEHRSERRRALVALGTFGVASAAVLAVIALYFLKVGALDELVDVLINYNRAYVANDRGVDNLSDFVLRVGYTHNGCDPWASVVHVLVVVGLARGGLDGRNPAVRGRYILAAALIATAAAGVFAQAKFYPYHWGLLVAGELLGVLVIAEDAARILRTEDATPRIPSWKIDLALVVSVCLLYALCFGQMRRTYDATLATAAYVTGADNRREFTMHFASPSIHYYFHDREHVGDWLREHSAPEDRVAVRSFEPTIYTVARRSYGGRFATTHHLTSSKVLYRREEWLAQDRADILRIKPRYVVACRGRPDMPGWPDPTEIDSVPYIEALGYREVAAMYQFVIMERVTD